MLLHNACTELVREARRDGTYVDAIMQSNRLISEKMSGCRQLISCVPGVTFYHPLTAACIAEADAAHCPINLGVSSFFFAFPHLIAIGCPNTRPDPNTSSTPIAKTKRGRQIFGKDALDSDLITF
jgi:hypothetical protein